MSKEYNDYFDTEEEEAPEEEKKAPVVEEETPEQIEAKAIAAQTIRKGRGLRKAFAWMIAVAVLAVALWVVIIFWIPFVTEAQQRGVIMHVQQEGLVFHTFEGQMITDERITDTVTVYSRDFFFSIENDSLARQLMQLQGTGRRVVLDYKEYRGALPWRGSSKKVVTGYKVQ